MALDLASITSHIHSWVLFLLWLHPCIIFGVISPLISSSILGTYWPGEFIFPCLIFLPFHTVHGVLQARIRSGLPFPSPVDHVLSELSTMTCLSWVALHGMAHSFIELDKAVVHVISLISFLWLWFSVCLHGDERWRKTTSGMTAMKFGCQGDPGVSWIWELFWVVGLHMKKRHVLLVSH